jgi:hypothetical protein
MPQYTELNADFSAFCSELIFYKAIWQSKDKRKKIYYFMSPRRFFSHEKYYKLLRIRFG